MKENSVLLRNKKKTLNNLFDDKKKTRLFENTNENGKTRNLNVKLKTKTNKKNY